MAKKSEWSIEQVVVAVAIAIIVGGGALVMYPTIRATLDAWQEARALTQRSKPENCGVSPNSAHATAVFCQPEPLPGSRPTHSSVDSPLGAVRRMDDVLQQ